MDIIAGYIAAFLIYAMIITIVAGWIFIWYYKIKCRKVKNCKNDKCRYRQFCDHKVMTDAEREELKRLLWERLCQENPNLSEGEQ